MRTYLWAAVGCYLTSFSPTIAAAQPTTTVYFGQPFEGDGPSDAREVANVAMAQAAQREPEFTDAEGATPLAEDEEASNSPTLIRSAASAPDEPPCPRAEVTVMRRFGGPRPERFRMPLLDCEGAPRREALIALSILARPRSVEAPDEASRRALAEADDESGWLSGGIRRVHPGLLERLQRIGEAFEGHPIEIISAHRPQSSPRSRHHHGRALDIRVVDVPRESLRDLAVTFERTGVGWYPNSHFVHIDVREQDAYWVDLSAPGERPRYVSGAEPPTPADEGAPSVEPATPAPWTRPELSFDALRGLRVPSPDALE